MKLSSPTTPGRLRSWRAAAVGLVPLVLLTAACGSGSGTGSGLGANSSSSSTATTAASTGSSGTSGTSGTPGPVGSSNPAAAASGFITAFAAGNHSAACGYVEPADTSICRKFLAQATFTVSGFGIGNTATNGDQALVSLLATQACAGNGSGGPTTTTNCFSNSDKNAGLPASNADFAAEYAKAFNGQQDPAIPCVQINGGWYVALVPSGSPSPGSGLSGTTGSAASGSTGTSGT